MRRRIAGAAMAAMVFGMVAGSGVAFAAPPVGEVGLHQHYINTPNGAVAIASQFCDGEQSVAFDNLHNNVHIAAPGLDRGGPVSMTPTGC